MYETRGEEQAKYLGVEDVGGNVPGRASHTTWMDVRDKTRNTKGSYHTY